MIDDSLLQAVIVLRDWGAQKSFVRRLWVFGSRLKGAPRDDSDIDVALEIDPIGNDEIALTSWISSSAAWREELQEKLPHKLDLQFYDSTGQQSHVVTYINGCSVLIYQRVIRP